MIFKNLLIAQLVASRFGERGKVFIGPVIVEEPLDERNVTPEVPEERV